MQVIQFATETSVNNVLIGHSENCRKSMESDFKLELFCEEQKTAKFGLVKYSVGFPNRPKVVKGLYRNTLEFQYDFDCIQGLQMIRK